jgi:ribonucleotide reductase alpha subunit
MQKWTDQAISADLFVKIQGDDKVSSSQMIRDYLDIVKYGMKTRYYVNSLTSSGVDITSTENAFMPSSINVTDKNNTPDDEPGHCDSCTL